MIALHPRPDRTWHLQPVVAVALILAACAALLGLPVRQAGAQRNMPQPNLLALFPPGGQAGTTVEVQITAQSELEGADRLHFSHPGIVAKQKMHPVDKFYPEPRPIEDTFRVTVAKDVPPGVYEVRAAGPFGASNARRFVVEEQPLLVEEENNSLETEMQLPLEGVVYGRAEQGRYDYYRIEAKRGEQLLIGLTDDLSHPTGFGPGIHVFTLAREGPCEYSHRQTKWSQRP